MINIVKNIEKKYLILFLFFALVLITPLTYSKYTSKYTKHIVISAIRSGYKVKFDSNGGNGEMAIQKFEIGKSQRLNESTFTKDHHVFLNWNTKPDGSGTSYEDGQEVTDLTTENGKTITLYAIYACEKFVLNGDIEFNGDNYINTNVFLFSEENIRRDFEVSFEIKERRTTAWLATMFSSMSESGNPYPGLVYRVFSDLNDQLVMNTVTVDTFNQQYGRADVHKVSIKRIYDVIYLSLNDGEYEQLVDTSSMTTPFDYPAVFGAGLDSNKQPQRYFQGTLSNLKVIVKDRDTNMGIIKYYPNGGVGETLSQNVLSNSTYTLMENTYYKNGYMFDGWTTNQDGTGTKYQDQQEVSNIVNGGQILELYAQWKKYKYTIKYDNNGGNGTMETQEFNSGVAQNLRASEFTKEGFTFAFWNTERNGSGVSFEDQDSVLDLGTTDGQVVTLYAMYEKFEYNFDGDLVFDETDKFDGKKYVDTHIYLFSRKNANKDFEISFQIKDYASLRDFDTIISSLDEGGLPYAGFVYRMNYIVDEDVYKYEIEANSSKSLEVVKHHDLEKPLDVVIKRVDGILKIKLGSDAEEEIINYNTLTKHFYYPLTVGASLDVDFNDWRHFRGTISNLKINLGDVAVCEVGQYSTLTSRSCTSCAIGSYSTNPSSGACNACQSGKTTSGIKSTSCDVDCPNNNEYVATWEQSVWNNDNTITNNCKIATCRIGYDGELSSNRCTVNNYKIAYNLDGGTHGENHPTTATFDQVVSISNPTKEGYEFVGWTFYGNTSTAYHGDIVWSDGSTKVKDTTFKNLTSTDEATVTLTANWNYLCPRINVKNPVPSNAKGLYKIMAEQAYMDDGQSEFVSACSGVDFANISSDTNGKGVYEMASTKDDPYPIFYYRGAVTNNNVKFGGFCWKAVRTTNTGGVKLIYNGIPDSNGHCNATGEATQIGKSKFNDNSNSLAYVGYMYGTTNGKDTGTPYTVSTKSLSSSDTYKYGTSVTYNEDTQKYTLTNTVDGIDNNHHYTCFSTSNICENEKKEVYYVYKRNYYNGKYYYFYITISGVNPNGRELIDIVKENMFSNHRDSRAKTEIERWYENNMTNYTSKIEDTVYCNDRSSSQQGGWSPTGSIISEESDLYFSGRTRMNAYTPSLACERKLDRFTVSSSLGNGELKYPVGLLTSDEKMLAGGGRTDNSTYYLYTKSYWAGSPDLFSGEAHEVYVSSNNNYIVNVNHPFIGLRPVVSLSRTSSVTGGDGSANNPYVIFTCESGYHEELSSSNTCTINNYKIDYNLDGGTHGDNHPTTATYDETITISNPTREGYEFVGWTFNGNTSTAIHGDTIWSYRTTKVKDTTFKNLTSTHEATVTLTANWVEETLTARKLYTIMAKQSVLDNDSSDYVKSSTGIDFIENSSDTNGKGVYEMASTKDDPYPIYYYRGAVTDNNVKFGEFCWKAVRTTNTGGVKLIYNGAPDSNGHCNATGEATQIKVGSTTTFKFNDNGNSPAYVGYMYGTIDGTKTGTPYTSTKRLVSSSDTYKFGKSVDYLSGTYTLTNAVDTIDNNHHYTCFSTSTTCDTLYYVYYKNSLKYNYITISGVDPGERELIDVVKESMFRNDRDSLAKIEIETWYGNNMSTLTSKIEDTVYCNDRSISDVGGWSPTGNMEKDLTFSGYTRAYSTYKPSLVCERALDRFTVSTSTGNGELKFPVGLLTVDEVMLAGGKGNTDNKTYYLYTNQNYGTGSPGFFDYNNVAYELFVSSSGDIGGNSVTNSGGFRPVVSLSHTSSVIGGDGTANNPYVIG